MKTVTIPRIEQLPEIIPEKTATTVQAGYFLLTLLTKASRGTIYATWGRNTHSAIWKITDETGFIFESPQVATEVLRIDNITVFRSMLARIGFLLTADTYLGCGAFRINFEGEPESPEDRLYAIMFSNLRSTGYWARLQVYLQPNMEKPYVPASG